MTSEIAATGDPIPSLPPVNLNLETLIKDLRSGTLRSQTDRQLARHFSQTQEQLEKSTPEQQKLMASNTLRRIFLGPGGSLVKPFYIDVFLQSLPESVQKTLCQPDASGEIPLIIIAREIKDEMHRGHKGQQVTDEGGPLPEHEAHIDKAILMGHRDLTICVWEGVPLAFIRARREIIKKAFSAEYSSPPEFNEKQGLPVIVTDLLLKSIPERTPASVRNFLYLVVYREMQASFSVDQSSPDFDMVLNRSIYRMVCLVTWLSKNRPDAAGQRLLVDVPKSLQALRWLQYFQNQKRELFTGKNRNELSEYGKVVMSEILTASILDRSIRPVFPDLQVVLLPATFDVSDGQNGRSGDIAIKDTTVSPETSLLAALLGMIDVSLRSVGKKPSGVHASEIPVLLLSLDGRFKIAANKTLDSSVLIDSIRLSLRAGHPYSPFLGLAETEVGELKNQMAIRLLAECAKLRNQNQQEILANEKLAKNLTALETIFKSLAGV